MTPATYLTRLLAHRAAGLGWADAAACVWDEALGEPEAYTPEPWPPGAPGVVPVHPKEGATHGE